jgi:hypothetical protein
MLTSQVLPLGPAPQVPSCLLISEKKLYSVFRKSLGKVHCQSLGFLEADVEAEFVMQNVY